MLEPLAQHKIRIRYDGGLADRNALPGYDGATSIDGITRAVHIATHAYISGEVVSRATAMRGASILIRPPRPGSFIFDLQVLMESYPATTTAAVALSAQPFYDFIKVVFKRATGSLDAEPETAHLRNLYERKEPPPLKCSPADIDLLAETLEGSLQSAHRPIDDVSGIRSISIGSSRQELVNFDIETKDWVSTQEEAVGLDLFRGNVTRYNSLSRNGRAYIDRFERVLPFKPVGDFPAADLANLTWSLHGSNIGLPHKLDMRARIVTSASGRVKRLLLSDWQRAPTE